MKQQDYRATARWPDNRVGEMFDMGLFITMVKELNQAGLDNAEAGRAVKEYLKSTKPISAPVKSISTGAIQQTKNLINRLIKAGTKKR